MNPKYDLRIDLKFTQIRHTPIRGNYPVNGHDFPLPEGIPTIPSFLREHGGYTTALIGKWVPKKWNLFQ